MPFKLALDPAVIKRRNIIYDVLTRERPNKERPVHRDAHDRTIQSLNIDRVHLVDVMRAHVWISELILAYRHHCVAICAIITCNLSVNQDLNDLAWATVATCNEFTRCL